MRRLFLLVLIAVPAFGQIVGRVNGTCSIGGVAAQLQGGVTSTNTLIGSYPGCTVTVFQSGTTKLATIYADLSQTPLGNPFTASPVTGEYFFYGIIGATVDVTQSGGGLPVPHTLAGIAIGGGGGAGGGQGFTIFTGNALPSTCDPSSTILWNNLPYICNGNNQWSPMGGATGTYLFTPQMFGTGTSTCAGQGEDDTACLLLFRGTALQIQSANPNASFVLESPPGLVYRYTDSTWAYGIRYLELRFHGAGLMSTYSGVSNPSGYTFVNNLTPYSTCTMVNNVLSCGGPTYFYGYLTNTINPGPSPSSQCPPTNLVISQNCTAITMVNAADAGNFTVGMWVMPNSYDQQWGGFPPNVRYFDFVQVVSSTTSGFSGAGATVSAGAPTGTGTCIYTDATPGTNGSGAAINVPVVAGVAGTVTVNNYGTGYTLPATLWTPGSCTGTAASAGNLTTGGGSITGVVAVNPPVANLHSANFPEWTANANSVGRARLLALDKPSIPYAIRLVLDGVVNYQNPNMGPGTAHPSFAHPNEDSFTIVNVKTFIARNCHLLSFSVSTGVDTASVYDSIVDYTQPDKAVNNLTFDNSTIYQVSSAAGINVMKVRGGSIGTTSYLNGRNTIYDGVIFNGQSGPTGAGIGNGTAIATGSSNPYKLTVTNSIFNGNNSTGIGTLGSTFANLPGVKVIIDGSNNTITSNYTLSLQYTGTSSSPGASQQFLNCLEPNGLVTVVNPTNVSAVPPNYTPADSIMRYGIVKQIYGGLSSTNALVDIAFNTTIPPTGNYLIYCSSPTSILFDNNTVRNQLRGSNGATNLNFTVFPFAPRMNYEKFIKNDGRVHQYRFDSWYGAYYLLNTVGVLTEIDFNVVRPYTGTDSTPTFYFTTYGGSAASYQTIDLTHTGKRQVFITSTANYSTSTTDVLQQLNASPSWPNMMVYMINPRWCRGSACSGVQLSGTQAQSAQIDVTLYFDLPFVETY